MAALNRIFLQAVILTLVVCLKDIYCLKSSNYFAILCLSDSKFWFMHTKFDCFKDGIPQCDQLALLPEPKRKCKRCCDKTSSTPILKSTYTTSKQSPPQTPKLLQETLQPYPGKSNSSSLATVLPIFIAAAAVLLIIIALQRKFIGCKRKHDKLETVNPAQGATLQGDTEMDVTIDPTQEEGDRLMTGSPNNCTIIPLDILTK